MKFRDSPFRIRPRKGTSRRRRKLLSAFFRHLGQDVVRNALLYGESYIRLNWEENSDKLLVEGVDPWLGK